MTKNKKTITVIIIIILAAASRLVDHPYNFTPIAAMSIFAGCYLGKRYAIVLPLAAMLISDFFIGFYAWQIMASVYASIALAFFIGKALSRRKKWHHVAYSSLLSSVLFFIITNFSVWVFASWYPHTISGLAECYAMAIPFFKNTIAGDLFYTGIFFGIYEAVLSLSDSRVLNEARHK